MKEHLIEAVNAFIQGDEAKAEAEFNEYIKAKSKKIIAESKTLVDESE